MHCTWKVWDVLCVLPKGCEVSGRGLPVYGKRAESVSPLWAFLWAGTDQKHISQKREGKSKLTAALTSMWKGRSGRGAASSRWAAHRFYRGKPSLTRPRTTVLLREGKSKVTAGLTNMWKGRAGRGAASSRWAAHSFYRGKLSLTRPRTSVPLLFTKDKHTFLVQEWDCQRSSALTCHHRALGSTPFPGTAAIPLHSQAGGTIN